MAIIDMIPKWSGDEADAAVESGGSRLSWSITVDDPANDTSQSVKLSATVPVQHPSDPAMILSSFRVRRLSPIYFELDAQYVKDLVGDKEDPPTDRPAIVLPAVSFNTFEEPVDVDQQGFSLRNVNGEGFDPPCVQEFNDLVLTFEKNVATVDFLEYWALKGSVASDAFYGFPAKIARCLDISATPAQEGDELFYKQKTTIAFRKPLADTPEAFTWWRRIISEGYYERLADDRIVRALDEEGAEMTRPVLLDRITGERVTTAQWAYHQRYPEVAFGDYNLT